MKKVFIENSLSLQKALSDTLKKHVEDNKSSGKYGIKDLYDAVSKSKKAPCYKDKGNEVAEDLKYETFRGWYYGNNPVDLKWIPAICDVLQCDIGYLFGERDCRTKDLQGVVDYTGLTEVDALNLAALSQKDETIRKAVFSFLHDLIDSFNIIDIAINYDRYKQAYYNQDFYSVIDDNGEHLDTISGEIGYLLLERALRNFIDNSDGSYKWSALRKIDPKSMGELLSEIERGK